MTLRRSASSSLVTHRTSRRYLLIKDEADFFGFESILTISTSDSSSNRTTFRLETVAQRKKGSHCLPAILRI